MKPFYLASHDYISSPEPRMCHPLRTVRGIAGRLYHVVDVSPPLPKAVGGQQERCQILLAFCREGASLDDIGKSPLIVDIFYSDVILAEQVTESRLHRIGTGTVHANVEEAEAYSPLE